MQLNAIMKENNWALHRSPMDGHCLLHNAVTSYNSQLPDSPKLLLSSLIEKIVLHVNSHLTDYTIFGLSVPKILSQLEKYIHERKYNSDFGDLVPLIITQVLSVNLLVLDTDCSETVKQHLFEAFPLSTNQIAVHRCGEHYNGLTMLVYPVPSPIKPPSPPSPPPAPLTLKTPGPTLLTINDHQAMTSLPHPWSLDPLPPVTPLLLPHLFVAMTTDIGISPKSDSVILGEESSKRLAWSWDSLLKMREYALQG